VLTPKRIVVIAPHPDDEVLGVGGTLLRRKAEGATVAWLIMTRMLATLDCEADKIRQREVEIQKISALFDFDAVFQFDFPTTRLDTVPMSELVSAVSRVFEDFRPEEIFLPHSSDVHTDHQITYNAVASCTKWFRYPYIKRVLTYETLSETDFGLDSNRSFRPNVFVNIEPFLDVKLKAMDIYATELGNFPFPRSHEAIRALATLRGAASGFREAEAFELLRERL
jgi:LmbE family N-acetylglucosaminyl deacetylase